MKARKSGRMLLLFLLIGVVSICFGSARASAAKDETICNGVYIDEIDVSGMSKEEAKEKVDQYVEGLKQKEIGVVLSEDVAIIPIGDLGYTCNENSYIDEALNLGKLGNLIKRYKELKDVETVGKHYELDFTLDEQKVREFIETQCTVNDVEAVNASVSRSNGQFSYTESVTGSKVNQEATYKAVTDAILKDWDQQEIVIDAVIEEDIPKYDYDTVKKCDTLIGTFNTDYHNSTTERKNNIANAARLINNSVVYPGDTFSCYEKMNPFTVENGYYSAHAYVNGMVEDSIGGGVCQVSTTLYNAVLHAELTVVERAAHSMTVTYVPVSFDAAIAGTYKDLKFKNEMDVPVLIEAIANGSTLTFNVYGYETHDTAKRRIEFKSEVISKTEPPKDVITEDPTQPTSYRKVTQNAYTGYVAVLYKYVYENDVLVDTIQINKSTYNASPNYITVGTKEEVAEEEDPDKDDPDKGDKGETGKEDHKKPVKPNKGEATDNDKTDKDEKPVNKGEKPADTSEGDDEEDEDDLDDYDEDEFVDDEDESDIED